MSIYWERKYITHGITFSGMRSTNPLYYVSEGNSLMDSCAEIMFKSVDGVWIDFWVGHPGDCHDILKAAAYITRRLCDTGTSVEKALNQVENMVYYEDDDYRVRTRLEWVEAAMAMRHKQ